MEIRVAPSILALYLFACGKTSTTTGTKSAGEDGFGGADSAGGIGGFGACYGPENGVCERSEDCSCGDCTKTARCMDMCTSDGVCNPEEDRCTCPDCDADGYCSDLAGKNCVDDGVCDSYTEGCLCADCESEVNCTDNRAACDGGSPNGKCSDEEACECADCFGTAACFPCNSDGECTLDEACTCVDCRTDEYCTNTVHCTDDGTCSAHVEGCVCGDCSSISACVEG